MSLDKYSINYLYIGCKILNMKVNKDTKKKELVKLLENKLDMKKYSNFLEYFENLDKEEKTVVSRASGVGGGAVPVNEFLKTKNVVNNYILYVYFRENMKNILSDMKTVKKVEKNFEVFKKQSWDMKEENIKLVKDDIKQLKKIIKGAPNNAEDLLLFRGIHGTEFFSVEEKNEEKFIDKFSSLKNNEIFSFDIFSYFSMNLMHSLNFTGTNCCFFKLNIKANSYPVFFTGNTLQKEVIFNPDVKFKVDKVRNITSEINSNYKLKGYDISIY